MIRNLNKLAIGMLLFGILQLPYGYYTLLRISITVIAGINIITNIDKEDKIWAIVFALIAILFNPFIPIYLDKSIWIVIDLIIAGIFGFISYKNK